jgi:hypothetical protein
VELELFKALVISPNERTVDFGSLLAIARMEACRREQVQVNPTVRALVFVAELGVYVAVYEVLGDYAVVNGKADNKKVDNAKAKQGAA